MVRLHGEVQGPRKNAWEGVFAVTRRIPRGKVMTYGQIATLLGNRLSPRAVGWALHGCPRDVPWHRVVNAQGRISLPAGSKAHRTQRRLLEEEGVVFRNGKVNLGEQARQLDLDALLWRPRRD